MFLLEWTASDLLLMLVGAAAIIGTVLWVVPGAQVPRKAEFSQAEITSYDRQIPQYFLFAALALVIGGLHIVVKSIPGFWEWLWRAGYGGHLFRDLANSHIIIVGGGTVLLTALTWYLLPRTTNRPLFSNALAGASLWFTVIGVFGFYLSWLVLGLVEGSLVSRGWDYMAAKESLGAWHRVPTRITSTIMGVGYWTYVLNVFLTIGAARFVKQKPYGYLNKFILVSAAALFVGTVQGVLQVLPANADWIHYAGKYGEYVDPISHAHINLVTGMVVALAGFLVFFSPRLQGKTLGKSAADRNFWTLVPGSLLFYLTFLLLGLILGGAVNGTGGIQAPWLVPFLSKNLPLLLSVGGSCMLAGFWVYFITVWQGLGLRSLGQQLRAATPAAFWLVSSLALVVGTFQGLLQLLPPTLRLLTTPEEVPNIHAQLNMIGGVLLALIGLVYHLLPELVGKSAEQGFVRKSLYGLTGGIGVYYVATLSTGLLRFNYMLQGLDSIQAAERLGWAGPFVLLVTSLPLFYGFCAFGLAVYRATGEYRAALLADLRQTPSRVSGPMPSRLRQIPIAYLLGMEFAGGLFGWPGIGWLYAGQAIPAIFLMLAGPAVTWALLPMLFSPFTGTVFSRWGWPTLLVWLPVSALLSSSLLWLSLHRHRRSGKSRPMARQRRIPYATLAGFALVLLALITIPLTPLVMGIPAHTNPQPVLAGLPDRATGAYLEVGGGPSPGLIKLFAWNFPLDEFPSESPTLNPQQLAGLLVSQKGLDAPAQYRLFHLEDGAAIPLQAEEIAFQRQLRLVPGKPLAAGRYLMDIPAGGMFAGREYYYFRVDPAALDLPVTNALPGAAASAPPRADAASEPATARLWVEIFPLTSALVSGWMALVMANRLRKKSRPQEAAWTLAFMLFSVAALSQVVGDLRGWTPALARLYYVSGATLVVGWLGLGTWLVLVQKPWLRTAGVWVMLLLSGYGIGLVSLSPVDAALLATEGWHALSKPLPLTILTISINSIGTLVLIGGALWSAWTFWRKGLMRERMVGLVLLALGALAVAAGGSLTRLGYVQYLYIAMAVGISLMFWGYLKTIQPTPRPNSYISHG